MTICTGDRNQDHEEVVYEGRTCPLCFALEEIKNQAKEIGALEDKIDQLNTEA